MCMGIGPFTGAWVASQGLYTIKEKKETDFPQSLVVNSFSAKGYTS